MSLPMLCNMGLSGVAFVGCDVGAFAGNATAELFARWMRGCFIHLAWSLARLQHAMSRVLAIASNASAANISSCATGYRCPTSTRSLGSSYNWCTGFYAHYYTISQRFQHLHTSTTRYFGPSLMAAPIYRPESSIALCTYPCTWYDWWSGDHYEGPTHILPTRHWSDAAMSGW